VNVKAIAKGGPLDGQEVECNGDTVHVPVARCGKPSTMFIYKLRELRHEDRRSEFFLLPLNAADMDEMG